MFAYTKILDTKYFQGAVYCILPLMCVYTALLQRVVLLAMQSDNSYSKLGLVFCLSNTSWHCV